ncbi:hypothetical protein DSO57_1033945 [Entomophthora muscae]|uniref:Uncharacterized protein n=1 Tax=Entomophthora muscae TaxID=34485 RepID=A0ACC2SP99_9FUNG|nr:hypothetical protein DSO57_1033945 [Entomophthora muscae]
MIEASPEGRSNAVQLLRRATKTRLTKSPPPSERSHLRKSHSFNAYPGFIPDPEIQERLRKQSVSALEETTSSSPTKPLLPLIEIPESPDSIPSTPTSSNRQRVKFRKSGLPSKKKLVQRKSKAIHAKVITSNRLSKAYGNSRREPPPPVIAPDPLGFLASQFEHKNEFPSDPPKPQGLQNPQEKLPQRRLVRRSRSFNELEFENLDRFDGNTLTSTNQRARELGVTPGITLNRSKSHRQIKRQPTETPISAKELANIPLEGVPEITTGSPVAGLRRWLSVGRRDKMPSPASHPALEASPPKPTRTIGRMRSLKWVGKKILPEATENSEKQSKNLIRSKTTLQNSPDDAKQFKLSRSHTERKGQGEVMRSLRHFFDFLSPKAKNGPPTDVQLVDSSVRKKVVENPELSLKELEIHDSVVSPPLERSFITASPEQTSNRIPTPNISDVSQEYFSIPPRNSRRPAGSQSLDEHHVSILDDRSFSTPPLQVEYVAPAFAVAAQLHFSPPSSPLDSAPLPHALVHRGSAKQILDSVTVKDRMLLLLDHVLIVAKAVSAGSQLVIKKVIWIDAITEVTTRYKDATSEDVPLVPDVPRKYQPVMMAAIRRFEIDPSAAISYLVARGAIKPDAAAIARLLHNTPELDRGMLGRLLSNDRSQDLLTAFLARFDFTRLRLDHALRILLQSMRLPISGGGTELLILNRFAHVWHHANLEPLPTFLPLLDVLPVTMALLELSRLGPASPPSLNNFLGCSQPQMVPLLEQMYKSVMDHPISESRGSLPIGIGGRHATRFILGQASDPIWVRIPAPDPGLRILLHGSGMVCQPTELDFSDSDTQYFTVTGSYVGRCSLMFILMGHSTSRYEFIPPKAFIVEQPFMKHTLSLSFTSPAPGDSAFHEDIILASQAPLPSRRASAPQVPQHPPIVKKYLLGMNSQDELNRWLGILEHTIDLYQETQDEQAAQIEDEAQREAGLKGSDWMQHAEETSRLRHQAQTQAAINHFLPLLDRPMSPNKLVALASARYFP